MALNGGEKVYCYYDAFKGCAIALDPNTVIRQEQLDRYSNDKDVARFTHPESGKPVAWIEKDQILKSASLESAHTGINRMGGTTPQFPLGTLSPGFALTGPNPPADRELNPEIELGVIDSGIATPHAELVPEEINFDRSYAFQTMANLTSPNLPVGEDGNGHGTAVTGIAAAAQNGQHLVGVAPDAEAIMCKFRTRYRQGTKSSGAKCFGYFRRMVSFYKRGLQLVAGLAPKSPEVILFTYSAMYRGPGFGSSCANATDSLYTAICSVIKEGIVVVVAAGNDFGQSVDDYIPAAFPEVLSVQALVDTDGLPGGLGPNSVWGLDDSLAMFSNVGADVSAPGVEIPTLDLAENSYHPYAMFYPGYAIASGTSLAAAHVAGMVTLLLNRDPSLIPQNGAGVKELINRVILPATFKPGPTNFVYDYGISTWVNAWLEQGNLTGNVPVANAFPFLINDSSVPLPIRPPVGPGRAYWNNVSAKLTLNNSSFSRSSPNAKAIFRLELKDRNGLPITGLNPQDFEMSVLKLNPQNFPLNVYLAETPRGSGIYIGKQLVGNYTYPLGKFHIQLRLKRANAQANYGEYITTSAYTWFSMGF